jgi:transcriptional regulator GlxA family with amidase domain
VITSEKCEQARFIEQPLPRRPIDARMAELLDWLLREHVVLAQSRLETTTHSVEEIAAECGFGTGASLRQHFARKLKTSPTA